MRRSPGPSRPANAAWPTEFGRPSGVLGSDLDDLGALGRALHSFGPLDRRGLRFIVLADCDDLAVAGLEPEPELSGLVLLSLELASHGYAFHSRADVCGRR
jgi:hypothetical protein